MGLGTKQRQNSVTGLRKCESTLLGINNCFELAYIKEPYRLIRMVSRDDKEVNLMLHFSFKKGGCKY